VKQPVIFGKNPFSLSQEGTRELNGRSPTRELQRNRGDPRSPKGRAQTGAGGAGPCGRAKAAGTRRGASGSRSTRRARERRAQSI